MPSLFSETDQETTKSTRTDERAKKSEKCRVGINEKWIDMNLRENRR